MSIRNDFVAAYAAAKGCTPQAADGLLRRVEVEYAEAENTALRQQLDDVGGQRIQEEATARRHLYEQIDRLTDELRELKKREE